MDALRSRSPHGATPSTSLDTVDDKPHSVAPWTDACVARRPTMIEIERMLRARLLACAALGVAVGLAGCTSRGAQPGELFLSIESSFARDGEDGVDRYELRVFRRSESDRRWVLISAQRYAWTSSDQTSAPAGAIAIRDSIGRHVLRAEPGTESQPVLIEAWPGRAMTGDAFEPAAQPSVAQFSFPARFVGRLTLRFEPVCQAFEPLLGDVQRAPYVTCIAARIGDRGAEASCATLAPICVTFESRPDAAEQGSATRVECVEAGFDVGGNSATRCVQRSGNGADAGASADGAMAATVASGVTLRSSDNGCGSITCGVTGDWSRCVGSIPCGRAQQGSFACCAARAQPPQCLGRVADIPRATQCPPGVTCNAVSNRCECGQIGQRCCGTLCSTPGTVCDPSETCQTCGGAAQPCCANSACARGFTCRAGRCNECGGANQPCCAGSSCNAGALVCLDGQCLPCGTRNQPCCAGQACFGFNASSAVCVPSPQGARCRCGAEGQICCAQRGCDTGLHCVDTPILPGCVR